MRQGATGERRVELILKNYFRHCGSFTENHHHRCLTTLKQDVELMSSRLRSAMAAGGTSPSRLPPPSDAGVHCN